MADTYERAAVPWFEPMAVDLVMAVGLRPGARVLDVGTGTGLVAELARARVGQAGLVVGVDPSTGMLRLATSRRHLVTAAAGAPGLPFPDAVFDAVVANLVISHVPDLTGGLADMVRLLRPGGRLGVTAWAPDPSDHEDQATAADGIIASVRAECGLPSEAPVKGAPWEQELRSRARLMSLLAAGGLGEIEVVARDYRRELTMDDYLSGWGGLGRYLRWQAGEARWQDFSLRAAARLRQEIGTTIAAVKTAWVATGSAP